MTEGEAAMDWPTTIHHELRALHESMARLEACTRSIADAVNRQNGRVGKLEESDRERELREQFAKGAAEQKSQTVLSRGQLGLLIAVMGAGASVAGFLGRLL